MGVLNGQATLPGLSASASIREGRTTVFENPDEVKPAPVGVALSGDSATVILPKQSVAAVLLRLAQLRPDTGAARWARRKAALEASPETSKECLQETCGDFIVEQDCHGVDVLNWYAKSHPLLASGAGGKKIRPYGDCNDHANITYEYANGLRGLLHGCQLAQGGAWSTSSSSPPTEPWRPAGSITVGTVPRRRGQGAFLPCKR